MSTNTSYPVTGAGLGLRRDLLTPMTEIDSNKVDFMEIAPENWIGIGGRLGKQLRHFTERYPFVCHGLSLSLGSPSPLDIEFIQQVKQFLNEHDIKYYSEHLSYCSDHGHLYDLMPIPFTDEAISYVASRIKQTQEILEQPIALENVSYYAAPGQQMSEIEFINAVLDEADCGLLLDVNNIYVNSVNHGYDPHDFLLSLPAKRIAYIHVAGHYNEADDLIVDTHGADVIDPVWELLRATYQTFGVIPTLLERDFNFPPINELLSEVEIIKSMQQQYRNDSNSGGDMNKYADCA